MPGPVSDSYDPEFGTGANAGDVKYVVQAVRNKITRDVFRGDETLRNIVEVVHSKRGRSYQMTLTQKEWRVIRFALNRALETI